MLKERIRACCAMGWKVVVQHDKFARLTRKHKEKTLQVVRGKIVERNFTSNTGLDMPVEIDF